MLVLRDAHNYSLDTVYAFNNHLFRQWDTIFSKILPSLLHSIQQCETGFTVPQQDKISRNIKSIPKLPGKISRRKAEWFHAFDFRGPVIRSDKTLKTLFQLRCGRTIRTTQSSNCCQHGLPFQLSNRAVRRGGMISIGHLCGLLTKQMLCRPPP